MKEMSRLDVADLLADAFGPSGAGRSQLVELATAKGAHPHVIEDLRALPDRRYSRVRELWPLLPQVPTHHPVFYAPRDRPVD